MAYKHKHLGPAGVAGLALTFLAGLAVGSACMFFFDPDRGRRRRALARDKSGRYAHDTGDYLRRKTKYHWQRAQGTVHEATSALHADNPTDEKLCERVRSAVGRVVSNPSAIEVVARDGVVSLYGPVPAEEVDSLLNAVCGVRSVRDVVNRLDVHELAQDIPG